MLDRRAPLEDFSVYTAYRLPCLTGRTIAALLRPDPRHRAATVEASLTSRRKPHLIQPVVFDERARKDFAMYLVKRTLNECLYLGSMNFDLDGLAEISAVELEEELRRMICSVSARPGRNDL